MLDHEGEPITGIDPGELLATLERALEEPYHGFTFEIEDPQRVGDSVFYATRIRMQFAGSAWGSVKFETSPPEGSASQPRAGRRAAAALRRSRRPAPAAVPADQLPDRAEAPRRLPAAHAAE